MRADMFCKLKGGDFIPQKYRYLKDVQYMLEAFRNQRADTVKEAIDLYEKRKY